MKSLRPTRRFNCSATAAKAITKTETTAPAGGEISLNKIEQVVYDGTQFLLISQ